MNVKFRSSGTPSLCFVALEFKKSPTHTDSGAQSSKVPLHLAWIHFSRYRGKGIGGLEDCTLTLMFSVLRPSMV